MKSNLRFISILIALLIVGLPSYFLIAWLITKDIGKTLDLLVQALIFLFLSGILLGVVNALTSQLVDKISLNLVSFVEGLFEGNEKKYLDYVIYKNRYVDTRGLTTKTNFNLPLTDVYVELNLFDDNEPFQFKTIWEFINPKLDTKKCFAVIGLPGTGKTTLLKQVALVIAKRLKPAFSKKIPILMFLRSLEEIIVNTPTISLPDVLLQTSGNRLKAPSSWFEDKLNKGRCIVMLDGLDEIADPINRSNVSVWVQEQMQRYQKNTFIVTSRPYGYNTNPLAGVERLTIKPFDRSQVADFIHQWYLAHETTRSQKLDEGIRLEAEDNANDLIRRLGFKPALSELAVNPLLATMIATIHSSKGILPERRADLYRDIFDVILRRRAEFWRTIGLMPAQVLEVLKRLAFHMMETRIRDISVVEASDVIREELSKTECKLREFEFLKAVDEQSSILLETDNGIYSFAHLTFQEYASSAYILDPMTPQNLEDDLTAKIGDSWWFETILLYAAQTNATFIISTCLNQDKLQEEALSLAMQCANEALKIDKDWREKLESTIDGNVASLNSEQRKIAAKAKLRSRARPNWMIRVNEKDSIDSTLITNVEYQLFIDEMKDEGKYPYPDHWKLDNYQLDSGNLPITGVRFEDAKLFCEWMTKRDIWYSRYRLPTNDEAKSGGIQGAGSHYWVTVNKVADVFPQLENNQVFLYQKDLVDLLESDFNVALDLSDAIAHRKIQRKKTEDISWVNLPGGQASRPSSGSSLIDSQWEKILLREDLLKCYEEISEKLGINLINAVEIANMHFLKDKGERKKISDWLDSRQVYSTQNGPVGNWVIEATKTLEKELVSDSYSLDVIHALRILESRSWAKIQLKCASRDMIYNFVRWYLRLTVTVLGATIKSYKMINGFTKEHVAEVCEKILIQELLIEERIKGKVPVVEGVRLIKSET